MSATRACGNVPPATSSLFLALYSHIHLICRPTSLFMFLHLHRHIMQTHTYKQTCKDTYSCPAGRCQAPGNKWAKDVTSWVFLFGVSGWNVRGKLREWVSTEQHGPFEQKVTEESCGDVCACIPTEKLSPVARMKRRHCTFPQTTDTFKVYVSHISHQHFYNTYPVVFRARVCELTPKHHFKQIFLKNIKTLFCCICGNVGTFSCHVCATMPEVFSEMLGHFPCAFVIKSDNLNKTLGHFPAATGPQNPKFSMTPWNISKCVFCNQTYFQWDVGSFSSCIWGKKVKHWNIFQPRLLLQHRIYSTKCQNKIFTEA